MKCNACWRELEGLAISTTCGHLLCTEDVKKILSNDGTCPICDQVLSKSLMKPVEVDPSDDWTNESMNRVVGQWRQKIELMQGKFTEKLEEQHVAYQKMGKKCQLMELEIEKT
ncbi:hypothetical protein SORBI_3010G164300 [Sorghum bicolor]|uniref:RING-type domain-containing protein n=1 Tax=Sorghum bicolor TaxID=4558 RepID=A0A194YJM8_SORBI|nr:hypothetical protein SORBI_3010G164300 [Sorghum bicolor]